MANQSISTQDAARALAAFGEAIDNRHAEINHHGDEQVIQSSDEETDSLSPIFDSFYNQGCSEAIITMTNFTASEFFKIWDYTSNFISTKWNVGRGRKSSCKGKDVLFMMLTVLKHGGNWDYLAGMFCMKGPTFERMIVNFIQLLSEHWYKQWVTSREVRYPMDRMMKEQRIFKYHPYCRYAVDVTFQQTNRPSGNLQESKLYFSGKHKLYGFKTEVSVLPNGQAFFISRHAPGSVADIDIFMRNIERHKLFLKKGTEEANIIDSGLYSEEHSGSWGVLCDKGYQGLLEVVRAVHPKKKPPRRILSSQELRDNGKISHDRSLVENWFGRQCQLWTVLSSKFRWKEDIYDDLIWICGALTNFHIRQYPLREDDAKFYQAYKTRVYKIGEEILTKRRVSQEKYRAKRRRRVNSALRGTGDDVEYTLPPEDD